MTAINTTPYLTSDTSQRQYHIPRVKKQHAEKNKTKKKQKKIQAS